MLTEFESAMFAATTRPDGNVVVVFVGKVWMNGVLFVKYAELIQSLTCCHLT